MKTNSIFILLACCAAIAAVAFSCKEKDKEDFFSLPRSKKADPNARHIPSECDDPKHFEKIEKAAALNEEGMQYMNKGDLGQAETLFNEALKIIPVYGDARFNLGLVYARKNLNDKALEEFDKVIKDVPDWPDAYVNKATLLMRQRKYSDAEKNLFEALKLDSTDPNGWIALGRLYFSDNKPDRGYNAFAEGIKRAPKELALRTAMLEELINVRKFKEAASVCEDAIKAFPSEIKLYETLVQIYVDARNLDKADETLKSPAAAAMDAGKKIYYQALILENRKKYAEAMKIYKRLVDEMTAELAKKAEENKPGESNDKPETAAEGGVNLERRLADIRVHLAGALFYLGKFKEVLETLEPAKGKTDNSFYFIYLGAALINLNKISEAAVLYQEFFNSPKAVENIVNTNRDEIRAAIDALKAGKKVKPIGLDK